MVYASFWAGSNVFALAGSICLNFEIMTARSFFLFALLLSPFLVSAQPSWVDEGLVAHYGFEGDLEDLSGNGHHFDIIGSDADLGAALTISVDQSQAVTISPDFALQADVFSAKLGNKNRTVAAWVKYEDGHGCLAPGSTPLEPRLRHRS